MRAAGDVRLQEPFGEARVLATGGFGVRLARERGLLLRAAPWSEGDGLAHGLGRGAAETARDGRSTTGARCPAPSERTSTCVRRSSPPASARARRRRTRSRRGCLARERHRPAVPGREGVVRDRRTRAASVGAGADSGRPRRRGACRGRRRAAGGGAAVRARRRHRSSSSRRSWRCVSTRGDAHDRRPPRRRSDAGARRRRLAGADLFAAGADAGGIFTGGYGSGLAAASSTAASPPRRRSPDAVRTGHVRGQTPSRPERTSRKCGLCRQKAAGNVPDANMSGV